MQTTDYADVLAETAEACSLDPLNLSSDEFAALRRFHKKRVKVAWEYHFWPEVGRIEQRYYRAMWVAGTSYPLRDEVFYVPTQKYYQRLLGLLGVDQSIAVGGTYDGSGLGSFSGWAGITIVYFPGPNDTGMTDGARAVPTGVPYLVVNSTLNISGVPGAATTFGFWWVTSADPRATIIPCPPADAQGNVNMAGGWAECQPSYSAADWVAGSYALGSQVQWVDGLVYQATAPATGAPGTDAAWVALTDFDRYVAWEQAGETAIGVVAAVWRGNPRTCLRNGQELVWSLSENGVQVATPSLYGWVEFRLRCPALTGEVFSATSSYASGAQVYFSDPATPGNFYTALGATTAGQSPVTAPGSWGKVSLPLVFHDYLVHGSAADWLKGPGADRDAGLMEEGQAAEAIERQRYLLTAQQGQRTQTVVQTR